MRCKNCSTLIPDDVLCCPYCDSEIDYILDNIQNTQSQQSNIVNNVVKNNFENALIGRKYNFTSPWGMNIWGLDGRIRSNIELGKDRLFIEIYPKRKNTCPVIMLESILAIQLSKSISIYYILSAIVTILVGLSDSNYLICLLAGLFLWLGSYTKIQIIQKNGLNVDLYTTSNADAELFRDDIKKFISIR